MTPDMIATIYAYTAVGVGVILAAAGLAILLFGLSRLFLRFALRYYTSASS